MTPPIASPIAISDGKSAGPTRCAGTVGYDAVTASTVRASASSTKPKTASLSFTCAAASCGLLGDPDRLHRGAELGIRLRHELREIVRFGIDDAEPATAHELGVVLARD